MNVPLIGEDAPTVIKPLPQRLAGMDVIRFETTYALTWVLGDVQLPFEYSTKYGVVADSDGVV